MIALFATLPADEKIPINHVKDCQRLLAEFENFVVMSGCLKKVFLSIKGIYYQAQIFGQSVTWITPYQFSQEIPHDVDFKVMATFLELHETLLSFVNYKLYSDLNLVYPPQLDVSRQDANAGLGAFIMENKEKEGVDAALPLPSKSESKSQIKATKERIKTLDEKISTLENHESENSEEEESEKEDEMDVDDIPLPIVEPLTEEEKVVNMNVNFSGKRLFSDCVFWLSREVPRYSLEFVIKAFGGQCGWDSSVGCGSPFNIDSPKITHQITDRPISADPKRIEGREYLQPQWIYDCINATRLVKTNNYHPGEELPPHLSPFVVAGEDDYSPEEPLAQETVVAEVHFFNLDY